MKKILLGISHIGWILLISIISTLAFFKLCLNADVIGYLFFKSGNIGISIHKIEYFPWTDVAENIYAGFLVAKNFQIYSDFVMNHMPGIPFLLGAFFKLFHAERASPGVETLRSLYFLAIFFSAFFQLSLMYLYTRVFTLLSTFYVFLLLILYSIIYLVGFNFSVPMSESFYVPFIYGVILAIFRLNSEVRKNNAEEYFVIFGTIFLGLMIGLTEAPFLFIFGVYFWIDFILRSIKFKRLMIDRKIFWNLLHPVAFLFMLIYSAIICYYLFSINLKQFLYWNITFNSSFIQTNLLDNLANVSRSLMDKSLYPFSNLLLSQVSAYFLAIIFAFILAALFKLNGGLLKKIGLGLLFMILYFSFFWRITFSYKIFPSVGFVIALLVYLADSRFSRHNFDIRFAGDSRQFYGYAAFLIVTTCFFSAIKWNLVGINPFWSEVGICSLNTPLSKNCRCLTSDVWGPQFFMEQDVHPCPGFFPSLPPPFFEVSSNSELLIDNLKNGSIAINRHSHDMTPWVNEKLNDVYQSLVCIKFSENSSICYHKE